MKRILLLGALLGLVGDLGWDRRHGGLFLKRHVRVGNVGGPARERANTAPVAVTQKGDYHGGAQE